MEIVEGGRERPRFEISEIEFVTEKPVESRTMRFSIKVPALLTAITGFCITA